MDLDQQAIGADRGTGERHGADQGTSPGAVRRIDDDRQMRLLPQDRHGGEVERVAGGGLERANPAFAEDDVRVAGGQHVLGGEQPFLDRRRQATLQQDGAAALAHRLQEREVLHVARADLEDVDVLVEDLDVVRVDDLGDDRQAGGAARLGEELECGDAEPLERVRRRPRLPGAAAQDARALTTDAPWRSRAAARATRPRTGRP